MYKRRIKIFLAMIAIVFAVIFARLAYLQLWCCTDYRAEHKKSLRTYQTIPALRGRITDRFGNILAMDEPCYDLCVDYRVLKQWTRQRCLRLIDRARDDDWRKGAIERIAATRRMGLVQAKAVFDEELKLAEQTEKLTQATDRRWHRRRIREVAAEHQDMTLTEAKEVFEKRVNRSIDLVRQGAIGFRRQELGIDPGRADQDSAMEEVRRTTDRIVRRIARMRARAGGEPLGMEDLRFPVVTGMKALLAVGLREGLVDAFGVEVRASNIRKYRYGDAACHVIGVMKRVFKDDVKKRNISWSVARKQLEREGIEPTNDAIWIRCNTVNYGVDDDMMGATGVEYAWEEMLRGKRGYKILQNRKVVETAAPQEGKTVQLWLDIELQQEILARMGRNGAIVVMKLPSREILALVSFPTYDLNTWRRDNAKIMADGLNLPRLNRAVTRRYSPGSTLKPLAALLALKDNAISLGTEFHCAGRMFTGTRGFSCYHGNAHGDIGLERAIMKSCNVYFYWVGQKCGLARMVDWYKQAGFGSLAGTGLREEVRGNLPDRNQRVGAVGEARFMSIGQGKFMATPLQVCNAIATIGLGGQLGPVVLSQQMRPGSEPPAEDDEEVRLPVKPQHLRAVINGMYRAANESGGTAYKAFQADGPIVEVCAKTGTAQMPPIKFDLNRNGRIDPGESLSGDMAWCVGFAPRNNPKIAFAVVIDRGGGGGSVAGPIARDVVKMCERRLYFE